MPSQVIAYVHGVQQFKGGGVVGVGHHTHFYNGVVACADGTSPESELQRIDGVVIHVNQRQNSHLVVTVIRGS